MSQCQRVAERARDRARDADERHLAEAHLPAQPVSTTSDMPIIA